MIYTGDINELLLSVKHIMLDKHIKQSDIVNATGWSKQTIRNLLNGRQKNITLDTLVTLVQSIGCEIDISIIDTLQDTSLQSSPKQDVD